MFFISTIFLSNNPFNINILLNTSEESSLFVFEVIVLKKFNS